MTLVLLAAWTLYAGKDLSWDVLNHHVYLPFSLTSGRFATDLFAAGPQSTQHPLGYLPFWGLLALQLPSWAIGAALVVAHAAVAIPLWRLCVAIWPDPALGFWWRWLAMLLSLLAPSLLVVAGTSSTDPLSAVLVLWALALALPGVRSERNAALAGLLLGLAIVIKPTNLVFALACIAAWLCRPAHWRSAAVLALSTATCTLLVQAPWSTWLWQEFKSPLFPLFNQIFQSPYAPAEAMLSNRYTPQGVWDWVTRPFSLALPRRMTHTEALAPDLRPALAVLALAAAAVVALFRRARGRAGPSTAALPSADRELLAFCAVSYLGWLATSGNSRYALPLFVVLGLVLTRAVQRTLPAGPARIALGVVVVLQAAYHFELASPRFDTAVAWGSGPYIEVQVPQRLRDEPALHLSLGTPSFASVAPALQRDGAFINAINTMSLPNDGPLGERLRERLARWKERTRVLFKGRAPLADNERAAASRASYDRSIYRFDLQVDWQDCQELRILTRPPQLTGGPAPAIALTSCALHSRKTNDAGYAADLALAERAFGLVEAQCPRVFGPRPLATDADVGAWRRHYLNSDARLMVSAADGVLLSHFSAYRASRLGSLDEVLSGKGVDPCTAWRDLVAP